MHFIDYRHAHSVHGGALARLGQEDRIAYFEKNIAPFLSSEEAQWGRDVLATGWTYVRSVGVPRGMSRVEMLAVLNSPETRRILAGLRVGVAA